MKVPLFDAGRQLETLKSQLMAEVERVLDTGAYILGPDVAAFEQDIAQYLGANHAIGVASGTDALWLALKALGVGPGDHVLTSPFTFFATASAILNTGATPVFADIDPHSFNIDPEQVRQVLEGKSPIHEQHSIRPDTIKAILPVHLYGQAADMKELIALSSHYGISVVEDAAQALGAEYQEKKVGIVGHLGCFSFFPTKNLGAFGDGGLVSTHDESLAERVRLLRAHGSKPKYFHQVVGTNSRLDTIQAALLRVKLKHLDSWIAARQAHAAAYDQALRAMETINVPCQASNRTHTYHQYTIRVPDRQRDSLQSALGEQGIGTAIYYPVPLHLQPAMHTYGYQAGDYPCAERACKEALSLPIFPEMTVAEREYVVLKLQELLSV